MHIKGAHYLVLKDIITSICSRPRGSYS